MKNFEKFAKHLEDSISGVFLGAKIFHKKGYTVKINPSLLAPSSAEWKNYADNGDLEVSMPRSRKGYLTVFDVRNKKYTGINENTIKSVTFKGRTRAYRS
jgi:hypothetical protein